MTLIAADHISKYYGPTVALREICCEIVQGERVCLMGPNGAGKSTLLRCIAGLERPDEGRVLIAGEHAASSASYLQIKRKLRLSFSAGTSFFYSNLTLRENLELAAKLYGAPATKEAIGQLAERLGLNGSLGKYPSGCSQGVARRAGFARAVLPQPDLLFLDEPFAHLDADGTERVVGVLQELGSRGTTVLCATHEPWFAERFASRILYLRHGRLETASASSLQAERAG